MNEDESRLKVLIKKYVGRKDILESSELYYDLSISGDDASELLERIAKEFGIDMEGFPFHCYFPDETEAFFEHWGNRLGAKRKRKSLTVGHIMHAIDVGRWTDPITEAG